MIAEEKQPSRVVLVVDDEPEVMLALQALFLGKGYEMLTALDGSKAIQILQEHSVDLVLLDMKMPGVPGVEVLRFIRAHAPRTKVIVVTAYDVQFQEIVEKIGVEDFLMKPFGIQALTRKVEEVLGTVAGPAVPTPEAMSPRAVARAKLLLLEPSEYTYRVKEVFFSDREKSGGIYEVRPAYSVEEAIRELETSHPDIVLVDLSLLGQAKDLALRIMDSRSRPKEMIIHGSSAVLSPTQGAGIQDLSGLGIKVVQNESFTRAGLLRLAEVVHRTALSQGLVENALP